MAKNAIDQVVWPAPLLRDSQMWERNVERVKMLCELGEVTEWLNGTEGKDNYLRFPYKYSVDGVTVAFLPHWGIYIVGRIHLDLPASKEHVMAAVTTVKSLETLGLRGVETAN